MSEGARRKLVRLRRMRLLSQDNSELRRVSQSALLPQGARLLVPKDTPAVNNSQEPNHPNGQAHSHESNAGIFIVCLPPKPQQWVAIRQQLLTSTFLNHTDKIRVHMVRMDWLAWTSAQIRRS